MPNTRTLQAARCVVLLITILVLSSGCATTRARFGAAWGKAWQEYKEANPRQYPATRRQKYIKEHPGLRAKTQEAIRGGFITVGMTTEEVRASWGNPNAHRERISGYNTYTQWRYGKYRYRYNLYVLFFVHDRLQSWQEG